MASNNSPHPERERSKQSKDAHPQSSRSLASHGTGEGKAARIRPAWVVLGGAFGAFTFSAALMHSYPVYLVAFIADFGWSRAETSIAYSVSQLVGGVSSPLVGYLVDRLGPRRLLLLGGGLLVAGAARQRLCHRAVADRAALRHRHDDRRQLPRARRLRADAVAAFRAPARHGDLDRAIGQRHRARHLGAARAVADLADRLAQHLSGAGRR